MVPVGAQAVHLLQRLAPHRVERRQRKRESLLYINRNRIQQIGGAAGFAELKTALFSGQRDLLRRLRFAFRENGDRMRAVGQGQCGSLPYLGGKAAAQRNMTVFVLVALTDLREQFFVG